MNNVTAVIAELIDMIDPAATSEEMHARSKNKDAEWRKPENIEGALEILAGWSNGFLQAIALISPGGIEDVQKRIRMMGAQSIGDIEDFQSKGGSW